MQTILTRLVVFVEAMTFWIAHQQSTHKPHYVKYSQSIVVSLHHIGSSSGNKSHRPITKLVLVIARRS
jgi:hypothetical protein